MPEGFGHGDLYEYEGCTTGLCLLLLPREKKVLEGGRRGKKRRTGVEKIGKLLYLAEAIRHKDFEAFKPGDF